jgi:hypothetical protein
MYKCILLAWLINHNSRPCVCVLLLVWSSNCELSTTDPAQYFRGHPNLKLFHRLHARTPCTSPRGAVRLSPGIPEMASTARNHRRSAASHRHGQHGLGWWRHPWGGEGWSPEGLCHHGCHPGGHRRQLGHLSDQPWGRGGKAKCAGGQGTRWEGSGQLRSKPVGAETRQWAH